MAQKRPFLDTTAAIELDGRRETAQTLFVGMHVCCWKVLSYLDAGFEALCHHKDFWIACCSLLHALEH